jgi:hypothetical protein
MPEKKTIERAREDAREGKAPSTQAGEFTSGKANTERVRRSRPLLSAYPKLGGRA